jgi:hypothetical protein
VVGYVLNQEVTPMKRLPLASLLLLGILLGLWRFDAARADGALCVPIQVSPNVLNLESEGVWVTVHAEIGYSLVDGVTVTLNGVPVEVTKADNRGELVAKFLIDDVKGIVSPGMVELVLAGSTTSGEPFYGVDTVRVISVAGR